jgi:hypothetical protein
MQGSFSILVPTCGRRSLARTLASIGDQALATGDEVLLVTDGHQPHAAALFARSGLPGRCIEGPASRDYGAAQRNRGMDAAAGDYLLFMDDDAFAPGAFATIRAALRGAPGRPHLFRMCYAADGRVLWEGTRLAHGNVSTQMIVFPNRPDLKRWDSEHGHDYRFVVNNMSLWPAGALAWREEVIAVLRPHEGAPTDASVGAARVGPTGVAECFYRQESRAEGGAEVARCRLLEQISGVEETGWCHVRRDACDSCCRSFPPSPVGLNPVVASLLYGLALRVQERGGVGGCDVFRAADLTSWAEKHLSQE